MLAETQDDQEIIARVVGCFWHRSGTLMSQAG